MKIAVIGGNGFIGSRLVEQLQLAGEHSAVPIVRKPADLARSARFKVDWRIADALDAQALEVALHGCDAAVHVASGRDREIERLPAALCTAAAAAGIRRVVYLSDALVHGLPPTPGTNEHSPLRSGSTSPAINQRIAAERIFFQRCERLRLEGIALRPSLVYGPRSPWFASLARELRESRAWWFGDGRGIFNGIYVDNLVSAIFSALAAPATAVGKPYLIGDEETVTWREFYLATAQLLGAPPRGIASITELPSQTVSARTRLRQFAESDGVKAVRPVLPAGVKRLAKYILTDDRGAPDGWNPLIRPGPEITRERALQQQCRWRFPHKRAARGLGFHAPVAFPEALKRSVAWFAFAEGEDFPKFTTAPQTAEPPALPTS